MLKFSLIRGILHFLITLYLVADKHYCHYWHIQLYPDSGYLRIIIHLVFYTRWLNCNRLTVYTEYTYLVLCVCMFTL